MLDITTNSTLHAKIKEMLAERGDHQALDPDDSLFLSGRLDSLAATQVMMMLEGDYGIDLADAEFDITRLDTVRELEALAGGAR